MKKSKMSHKSAADPSGKSDADTLRLNKMRSKHVASQRSNADVLARLGHMRLANAEQSMALEQSQQREDERPTELLVVTIDALRSQFSSMLELFRHKEKLRATLEKQQQLNMDHIDVQTMQREETTAEQQSNVQNIQEELNTTKCEIESIQSDLNTHADNVRSLEAKIREVESVLNQQLQVLKELDDKCDDEQKRLRDLDAAITADEQTFEALEAEIVQHGERFEELMIEKAEFEYHLKFIPLGIERLQRQINGRRANLVALDEQFQSEWQTLNQNPCSSYAHVVSTILNLHVPPTDDQLCEAETFLVSLKKSAEAEFQAINDAINASEQEKQKCGNTVADERADEVSGDRMNLSSEAQNLIVKYRSFLTETSTENSVNYSVPLPQSPFSASSVEMF